MAAGAEAGTSVYVGKVPVSTPESAIRGVFSGYGPIVSIDAPEPRREDAEMRHFYVNFANEADAAKAVAEQNGKPLGPGGAEMAVDLRRPRGGRGRGGGSVERTEPDPSTVWIGGLQEGRSEEHLAAMFARFGTVKNVYPRLRSRRPWAFVTLSSPAEAAAAVAGLNGTKDGADAAQELSVEVQQSGKPVPKPDGGGRGGGGGGGGGGRRRRAKKHNPARVWVAGFSDEQDRDSITALFNTVAPVKSVRPRISPSLRRSFALVTFETVEGADAAVAQLNGRSALGGELVVEKSREPEPQAESSGADEAGKASSGRSGKARRSRRARGGADEAPNPSRVWVGGIDSETTHDEVQAFFGPNVEHVLLRGRAGWVLFNSPEAAQAAIGRSGQTIKGNVIEVQPASTSDRAILSRGRRGPKADAE